MIRVIIDYTLSGAVGEEEQEDDDENADNPRCNKGIASSGKLESEVGEYGGVGGVGGGV